MEYMIKYFKTEGPEKEVCETLFCGPRNDEEAIESAKFCLDNLRKEYPECKFELVEFYQIIPIITDYNKI